MLSKLVSGFSVAGLQTCLSVPSWSLAFDMGRCPMWAHGIPKVLFTHAHLDHLGGIAHHCSTRGLMSNPPPEYWVPEESIRGVERLFEAWRLLDGTRMDCKLTPVRPGDVIQLRQNQKAIAFRSIHRLPTLGYALVSTKKKLRPEMVGKPGPELVELKKAGVAIEDMVDTVDVVFCGDTTIEVLRRQELPRKARLLILECTYLGDEVTLQEARRAGHVHLDQIVEAAAEGLFDGNEEILLTHFSSRYSAAMITDTLRRKLPASLHERVTPLLEGF